VKADGGIHVYETLFQIQPDAREIQVAIELSGLGLRERMCLLAKGRPRAKGQTNSRKKEGEMDFNFQKEVPENSFDWREIFRYPNPGRRSRLGVSPWVYLL
jgi:hypothetical protein